MVTPFLLLEEALLRERYIARVKITTRRERVERFTTCNISYYHKVVLKDYGIGLNVRNITKQSCAVEC